MRKVAVALPDEALEEWDKGRGKVGMLRLSLYGTRDVAVNFQKEVKKLMVHLSLGQSKYNASLYCRKAPTKEGKRKKEPGSGRRRW